MRIYLHGERAEKSAAYTVTIAPAGDSGFVAGEVPQDWLHPDGEPKQIEIVFKYGSAEVDGQIGNYMVKRGLAHRSRLLRKVRQLFDRHGQPIEEVFDERGVPIELEPATA